MGQIRIDNLEIFANHGVLGEENVLGQKFIVSAVLDVDIQEAAREDNIEKSVNYAEVCQTIERYNKENTHNLIESVAEGIAIELLQEFPLIKAAEIEVKKPNAPIHMHFGYVSVTTKRKWNKAFISFGSNIGNREEYILNAIKAIEEDKMCKIKNISSFIETEPYGNVEQDNFINGCMQISTLYTPHELLECLQKIELDNNRERKVHWGPRTLDLDILLYEDVVLSDADLIIPHPDMTNRLFVLEPLCEIAPYALHPLENTTIIDLFKKL